MGGGRATFVTPWVIWRSNPDFQASGSILMPPLYQVLIKIQLCVFVDTRVAELYDARMLLGTTLGSLMARTTESQKSRLSLDLYPLQKRAIVLDVRVGRGILKSIGSPHLDRFCCRLSNQSYGRPKIMHVRPILCMEVSKFLIRSMIATRMTEYFFAGLDLRGSSKPNCRIYKYSRTYIYQ
jgi:hypothetical protein